MTLLIDTGPLVALADANSRNATRCSTSCSGRRDTMLHLLQREAGALIVPAPATAEVEYLLGNRFGPGARDAFLTDLASARFTVACLEIGDYQTVLDLERRYAALNLGLVDSSIVVLAARYRTRRIMTFDERHFRVVTPLDGGAFTILPADA